MTFSSWGFGSDTNATGTFPCSGTYEAFYIGRLGGETTAGGGGFNTTLAEQLGATLTSSFWDVAGPDSPLKPSSDTPTQWGVAQANAYIAAWESNGLVGGTTLFADIESGNGGWTKGNYGPNQAVLHAFLQTLSANYVPGVYISTTLWGDYFGTYTSTVPFVLWLWGTPCTATTCAEAESQFNSNYANLSLGGYKVMIWQYVIGPPNGCVNATQDLDITPYNGYETGHWNPTAA